MPSPSKIKPPRVGSEPEIFSSCLLLLHFGRFSLPFSIHGNNYLQNSGERREERRERERSTCFSVSHTNHYLCLVCSTLLPKEVATTTHFIKSQSNSQNLSSFSQNKYHYSSAEKSTRQRLKRERNKQRWVVSVRGFLHSSTTDGSFSLLQCGYNLAPELDIYSAASRRRSRPLSTIINGKSRG